MQLGNLEMLWLLLLVPLGFSLGIVRRNRKQRLLAAFADATVLPALTVPTSERRSREMQYAFLLAVLLGCLAVTILRPQWGFTWKEGSRRGVDIVFAVDVSDSMLAADVSPSRVERVRRKITDMLRILRGDRVALVSFAGVAFIETPLTLDYRAFRMFVDLINTDLVPVQGSNVELAIMKSMEALGIKPDSPKPPPHDSAILLFSDGEQLDGDVDKAIALAKANRVRIFTLGVGTPEGSPISMPSGYKKDPHGKVVITKMHPELLEKIAVETGGLFVQSVSSSKDLEAIYGQGIRRLLSAAELKGGTQKRWHEYFQLPLFIGVLVFLFGPWVELAARARRRTGESAGNRPVSVIPVAGGALLCVCFLTPYTARAADPERLGAEGKRAFEGGKFDDALERFEQAAESGTGDFRFVMGNGASYYRLNKFEEAQAKFAEAANQAKDNSDKAAALYNEANSLVQQGHFADAIKTYDQSLGLNPNDPEAKDNRAYAKRLLEEQKQQQSSKNKEQQNKDKDKKQSDQTGKGDEQSDDQKGDPNRSEQDPEKKDEQKDHSEQKPEDDTAQKQQSEQSSAGSEPSPQPSPSENNSGDDQSKDADKSSGQPTPQPSAGDSPSAQPSPGPSPEASIQPSPEPTQSPGAEPSHDAKQENRSRGQDQDDRQGAKRDQADGSGRSGEKGEEEKDPADASNDDATGNEELDSLLKGVEEKEGARSKFRELKAKQELRNLRQRLPERDW